MHIERGPQGKILVFEVLSGVEIVPHVFEGLRNMPLANVLPIYVREVFKEKQLCVDCTELVPLIDLHSSCEQDSVTRENFISFLICMFRAEDRFISKDYFILDPKYIFFNMIEKTFFWCCFPVTPAAGNLYSNQQSFSDRCNLLLSCEFITTLFDETYRKSIWTAIVSDNEALLRSFIPSVQDTSTEELPSDFSSGKTSVFLFSLLSIMLVSLTVLLSFQFNLLIQANFWTPLYTLVFGMALLTYLLFRRNNHRPTSPESKPISIDNKDTSVSELLTQSSQIRDSFLTYPTAFLRRLSRDKNEEKEAGKRYPILVHDFLIGKDSILCDLVLNEKSISDRHARILKRESGFFFMDVGSTNGCKVGDRLMYSHEEYPLANEDILSIGDIQFQFQEYK